MAGIANGPAGAGLLWSRGPWHVVPSWFLGSCLAAALLGVVLCLARLKEVPTWPGRGRIFATIGLVVGVTFALLMAMAV